MVLTVNYDANERSTDLNRIILSESAYDNNTFVRIINYRTLQFYQNLNEDWCVERLKTNN